MGFIKPLAEKGDACMQAALGEIYDGVESADVGNYPREPNSTEAARWYRLAAEQGHAHAQQWLAGLYFDGRGVRKDYREAASWYLKAAEQDMACAQSHLGEMYRAGQGVSKDYTQAYFWFNLASAHDPTWGKCPDEAQRERDDLEKKMTAAQIAEAQRLTREWKPKKSRFAP